ncbi:hypothetical protein BS78_02G366900 [Paspalum vaginatum]|nr:hypothetical protein BS78_02G366900 [Paspalum vaginatum]
MAKLSVVSMTLLALLGHVVCQGSRAPSASPPDHPPSLSPSEPNTISYPPSQSPVGSKPSTYPQSQTPSTSNPPAYPPSPSQTVGSQPIPSPTTYGPSTSPNPSPSPVPPNYPPSPSLTVSTPPTYPPSPSPSLPSPSPMPQSYPPSASPTSPSSSSPPTSPNSDPSSSISVPPTYPSSLSPSSPPSPTFSPSASPFPSISSPPTYSSPSPSPSSSISISPTYPPILSPTTSPTPSPSDSISTPPTYPPILSPSPSPRSAPSGLSVGYYDYSCPRAETIVREAVKTATYSNRGTGAGLIRLFFHDCFVQGCDASVLLNTTGSSDPTERTSAPNLSLRGFEVIDAAKAALEAACPGVVSCADIVAFAGRDATFFLSGNTVDFDMPAGRYDGRVSLDSEAATNLPPPFASLQQLKDMFAAKGLDTDDMVTLSGAHTVGRSHCSSFSDRLPPNASDMNATLSARLTSQCSNSTTVPQDFVTPDDLDTQYYRNVLNHEVLFASDAALLASNQTADMVSANAFTPGLWETKFKAAMVKMGRVGIKTSTDGEIRKKCWMIN